MVFGKKCSMLFLLAIIFTSGCTSVSTTEIGKKVLEASNSVDSYKYNLTVKVIGLEESTIRTTEVNTTFYQIATVDRKNKNLFYQMRGRLQGIYLEFDEYLIGNDSYFRIPLSDWSRHTRHYAQINWDNLNKYTAILTLLENSTIDVLQDEVIDGRKNYVIKITPDRKNLLDTIFSTLEVHGEMFSRPKQVDPSKIIKNIIVKLWIQKDTHYISKLEMDASVDYKFPEGSITRGYNFDLNLMVYIYDHNKPVNIVLPKEATEPDLLTNLEKQAKKIRINSVTSNAVTVRNVGSKEITTKEISIFIGTTNISCNWNLATIAVAGESTCTFGESCSVGKTLKVQAPGNSDSVTC